MVQGFRVLCALVLGILGFVSLLLRCVSLFGFVFRGGVFRSVLVFRWVL